MIILNQFVTKIFKSDVIEPFIKSENEKRLTERKTKAQNSNKKGKKVDEIPDLSTKVTEPKIEPKVEPKVTDTKVEPKVVNALTLDDSDDSDDEFSKLILKSD